MAALMEEVTNNVKTLQLLDKQLLDRLSNSTGNLLDDIELIEVLANAKAKSKEVEQKLIDAGEKKTENSEKCQPTSKRVDKIIDFLTYQVYRYMNRGLFVRDQMMFKILFTLNIMKIGGLVTPADIGMFLKGGSSLDIKAERQNPFRWMLDKVWLNVL